MRAEERLRFYSSIFPLVEVDATFYFPPTAETSGLWVNRTPPGFTMSVVAYGLLSGHPARPESVWPEVADRIPLEHREKRSVYLSHLPAPAVDDAWELFRQSLMPLHSAGKLGTVLFRFPRWFRPGPDNRARLRVLPDRLPDYDLAVGFAHGSWLADEERDRTLALLERAGLAFVCVDELDDAGCAGPSVVAATTDIAVVRFCGRSTATWDEPGALTTSHRFAYRYRPEELAEWVPALRQLAETTRETHVLMGNCYRDDAVVNARQLAGLLGEGLQPSVAGAD